VESISKEGLAELATCPRRIERSGSVEESLSPANRVEEWNGSHGSGELFDSDPQKDYAQQGL
jgi:hypothetical protein